MEKRDNVITSLRCEGVKEFRHRVIAHVLVNIKNWVSHKNKVGGTKGETERLRIRKKGRGWGQHVIGFHHWIGSGDLRIDWIDWDSAT